VADPESRIILILNYTKSHPLRANLPGVESVGVQPRCGRRIVTPDSASTDEREKPPPGSSGRGLES